MNTRKIVLGMAVVLLLAAIFSVVAYGGRKSRREVQSFQAGDIQSSSRILLPVFMYYAERYFAEVPEPTEVDRSISSILDGAREGRDLIQRALEQYKAIPEAAKLEIFDDEIVHLTADFRQPLDLDRVREIVAEDFPQMVEFVQGPPADPSNLSGKNRSTFEPPKDQVELNWQDNSADESGFLIYRALKPAGNQAAQAMQQTASVGPGVIRYLDTLAGYTQNEDQYCYQVIAYITSPAVMPGQPPQQILSRSSNVACSYVAVGYPLTPLPPDQDQDGITDVEDQCVAVKGVYPHGCPDKDFDGISDDEDMCETEAADMFFWYDQGPRPPSSRLGCPTRYSLLWMGMKVLNNSGAYAYPGYQFLSPGGKPYGLYQNEVDSQCTPGEEPYLVFTWTNGLTGKGMVENGTSRWCCGEGVDVKAGKDYEPDGDTCGEEFPANLSEIQNYGFTAFPGMANQFAIIDNASGFVMAATLWERDYDLTIAPQNQADELDAVFKMGGQVAGAVAGCVGSGGFGCLASIGGALKGIIEGIFGLMQSTPPPINVKDPDDFMGTDIWFINRWDALAKTSSNGAYAFTLPEIPLTSMYSCLGWQPCSVGMSVPTTLRVRPSFCLVREGVPKSDYKKLCSPATFVSPWPMK